MRPVRHALSREILQAAAYRWVMDFDPEWIDRAISRPAPAASRSGVEVSNQKGPERDR